MKTHKANIQMFAVGLTEYLGEKELHTIGSHSLYYLAYLNEKHILLPRFRRILEFS